MKKTRLLKNLEDYCDGCLDSQGKAWLEQEKIRLEQLWALESEAFPGWVVGCDEVGRGPMAGPLVAAAATSNQPVFIPGLNDSKKLTAAERERVCQLILASTIQVKTCFISPQEVSEGNLHQLSLQAMHRAVQTLSITPDLALIDGKYPMPTRDDLRQIPLIKGDSRSALIAAASIVAKVERDGVMLRLATEFPGYGWEKNVGYPTHEHREALIRLGITPHHRINYRPVREVLAAQGCVL